MGFFHFIRSQGIKHHIIGWLSFVIDRDPVIQEGGGHSGMQSIITKLGYAPLSSAVGFHNKCPIKSNLKIQHWCVCKLEVPHFEGVGNPDWANGDRAGVDAGRCFKGDAHADP